MVLPAPPTSYDEIPYASDPYPPSHPDHLATVATLFGLEPGPVDRCRVLELGCARGGNLIPMALGLPGSRFVGIDSSPGQVDEARRVVAALGLGNVEVEHGDIRGIDPEPGTFDYIICHGTYSWVPATVRDRILEVCARRLAPRGVAYVSYNTYPGWHLRGLVRDLMCYHVRRFPRAQDRVDQARAMLDFMARFASPEDLPYRSLLADERDYLRVRPDSYLLHDHLEEVNAPVYFHQFVEHAASKGLRFVSEVQGNVVAPGDFPPTVAETLHGLTSDPIEMEQFLDFLIDRKFRQSILCHATAAPGLAPRPEAVAGLLVASRPQGPHRPARFDDDLLTRAALQHLSEAWPRALPFATLLVAARSRTGPAIATGETDPGRDARVLAADLLRCYHANLVELHTHAPHYVLEVGERPVASPLARLQAEAGPTVTNLRHEAGQLSEFGRRVIRHLDGRHDREALLDVLVGPAEDGTSMDPGRTRDDLPPRLDQTLARLARFALLVG